MKKVNDITKVLLPHHEKSHKEMAARWKLDMKDKPIEQYNVPEEDEEDITVNDAFVRRYLSAARAVFLSPSTLRGYTGLQRQYFGGAFGQKKSFLN